MPIKLITTKLMLMLLISACRQAPECTSVLSQTNQANAGCLVMRGDHILIIEGRNQLYQLPGGGYQHAETAQCTAERETWEETGLQVTATKHLLTFDNGFYLYACQIPKGLSVDEPGSFSQLEVKAVHWLNLEELDGVPWRFPDQTAFLKLYLETHVK